MLAASPIGSRLRLGDRFGVILLERYLDAYRHRHGDQQTDNPEQDRAANKRYDHNDWVNPRRLAEHDRSHDIIDRQAQRDGEPEQKSRCPNAVLLDRDESHNRPRSERTDYRNELEN